MLPDRYSSIVKEIDQYLDRVLPAESALPVPIHEAMRYSLFAGGKRLRPALCLMAGESLEGSLESLLPVAASIEAIHTYSLIHDDLPSMDNDEFRRGKPTCHRVFGEAIAILAGDALLTLGFQLLSSGTYSGEILRRLVAELSSAAGTTGMIGGQVMDMQSEAKVLDRIELEKLHGMKTAALFGFSAKAAPIALGAERDIENAFSIYGQSVGLAFQIIDDILDVEGKSETLGKTAGKDVRQKKATYPSLIGLEESKGLASDLIADAVRSIAAYDRYNYLANLATHILNRQS